MGLVYDACKGQTERKNEDLAALDDSASADRGNTISDLFVEMEAVCEAQDGRRDDEVDAPTLFGHGVRNVLSYTAVQRLAAVGYAVLLVGMFVGAFAVAVWASSIDSTTGPDDFAPFAVAPMESLTAAKDLVVQPVALTRSPFVQSNTAGLVTPAKMTRETAPQHPAPGAVVKLASSVTITLNGILRWTGEKPIAIINGATVSPGDIVKGYTVLAIEAKGVMLLARGRMYYLELEEEVSPA